MTAIPSTVRGSLRLASALLIAGQLIHISTTTMHVGGEANNHAHIFADYAGSMNWTGIHVGQFAGMCVFTLGLMAFGFALQRQNGLAKLLAKLGAVAAVVNLALYGALQAVDGVALKYSVTAWVSAPETEKAARFASAESIRWLEWGMRSYQDLMLGISLMLLAGAVIRGSYLRPATGWLLGLCGTAYLVQGWIAGVDGFTSQQSIAILTGWVLGVAWTSWVAISSCFGRQPT
jgi:hypothetical protein